MGFSTAEVDDGSAKRSQGIAGFGSEYCTTGGSFPTGSPDGRWLLKNKNKSDPTQDPREIPPYFCWGFQNLRNCHKKMLNSKKLLVDILQFDVAPPFDPRNVDYWPLKKLT